MSYNVGGLHSKKIMNDFFKYVSGFEIFFLLESLVVDNKINEFEGLFSTHELYWIPAKKNNIGRPSEGFLFGLKSNWKNLFNCKFEEINGRMVVRLQCKSVRYYILPVYINYNNWNEDFSMLNNWVNEFQHNNLMIIGDFNARLGREQIVLDIDCLERVNESFRNTRNSKDVKVDGRGIKVIEFCDGYGFVILNGRTKGDNEGEFTYVSKMGCSVIDTCCIRGDWLACIESFEVAGKIFTQHMPISVTAKIGIKPQEVQRPNLLPKLIWNESLRNQYNQKLEIYAEEITFEEGNIGDISNKITNFIKLAAGKTITQGQNKTLNSKQKWFDWQCLTAREKCFKWLRLVRETDSNIAKFQYAEVNKQYKTLCQEKRAKYNSKLAEKIAQCRDSHSFWKTIREMKGLVPMRGKIIHADVFANFFSLQLNPPQLSAAIHYAGNYVEIDELDQLVTMQELTTVLKRLKLKKAPGEDRISYEFYKNAPMKFIEQILAFFNKIMQEGKIPESFKKSIICPIYKKGNTEDPENYRAITFTNSIAKMFTNILLNRMMQFIDGKNLLSQFQAGFRPGYSAQDHIFSLTNAINIHNGRKKKVYAMFIDFKTAFDKIDRRSMWFKLEELGFSYRFLHLLQELYNRTTAFVWDGESISEEFSTTIGLKQGCILSPILFILFVEDLIKILPGGIKIYDIIIKILLYADDMVILAESPESLQLMINRTADYCEKWNLSVNLNKSKIMVFRKGGKLKRTEKWFYKGVEIEIVNEYCYLGVTLTPSLSLNKHFQKRFSQAIKAINTTWKNIVGSKQIEHSAKFKVFNAVMRSIMCYGAQSWGYQQYDGVEKLQRYFIKRAFWLPINTPNYMLFTETGLGPLYLYTFKLHIDYVCKALKFREDRLPRKIAEIIQRRNILYMKKWEELAEENEMELNLTLENIDAWKDQLYKLLAKVDDWHRTDSIWRATNSLHRNIYNNLNYNLGSNNYFKDSSTIQEISTIFKTRGELLNLNFVPHKETTSTICSLCNLGAAEDTIHLIAVCPVLREIRVDNFKKAILTYEEGMEYLDGKNWAALASFVITALHYRGRIISESF